MIGDPGNVNPPALKMDKEEHVVGHQSSPREDLHREEIGVGQHRKMSPNEFCPGRRPPAFRRRRDAMTAENVADGLIGDMISQVGERPDNPIITPGPILLGHPQNQVLDFFVDWRSTHASLCS